MTMAVFDLAEISSVLGILSDCAKDLSSVVALLSVDVLGFT